MLPMIWTNSMPRTFLKRRHRNISLLSRSLLVEISSSSSSSSSSVIGASSQHHSSLTLMPSIRAMRTTLSYNGTRCQRIILMRGCAATSCTNSRRYAKATCSSQVAHNISSSLMFIIAIQQTCWLDQVTLLLLSHHSRDSFIRRHVLSMIRRRRKL